MLKSAQYSWRLAVVTLALLWLFQSSALAAIYHWKDDQGRPHFTDDISKIPLKYQQDIKKFKGVPPSPKAKEEAAEEGASGEEEQADLNPETGGEEQEEAEAAAEQAPANEEAEKEGEKEAESQHTFTPEELVLLKETHGVLMTVRKGKFNFFNRVEPTEANGDKYVKVAHSLGKLKKQMSRKIVKPSIPSLIEAKTYLKKSASRDRLVKTGSGAVFERRIKNLRRRMEKEMVQEKEIIEMLRADLGIEGPPLESLKAFKQKIAKAAKEKEKEKEKNQAPSGKRGGPL